VAKVLEKQQGQKMTKPAKPKAQQDHDQLFKKRLPHNQGQKELKENGRIKSLQTKMTSVLTTERKRSVKDKQSEGSDKDRWGPAVWGNHENYWGRG